MRHQGSKTQQLPKQDLEFFHHDELISGFITNRESQLFMKVPGPVLLLNGQ